VRAGLLLLVQSAGAQSFEPRKRPAGAPRAGQRIDQPALLSADTLTIDRELSLATASGHVEISQGDRVLLADTVSYNQRTGTVIATGHVSLMEPSGDVLFGEYVELEEGMRSGIIRTLRLLLADGSRMAANQGQRDDASGVTEFSKAVYSPCESCAGREPLWQIKAVRVVHDAEKQEVRYQDAVFELFGVPVAYLPFFSHADPTVKRQTGFLPPNTASTSDLGFLFEPFYYYAIDDSRDLTLDPRFYTKVNPVLGVEYRERTNRGVYQLDGSITRDDERDANGHSTGKEITRGHVRGDGRFDLDETWRTGFDLFRTTDDTYLARYRIRDRRRIEEDKFGRDLPNEAPFGRQTLTSDVFLEGFRGSNYAAASAFAFQGLRVTDDPGLTPLVTPYLEYSFVGEPSAVGGRFIGNASAYSLYRTRGTDSRRASLDGYWQLPYIAPGGDVFTLTAGGRGDVYYVNGQPDSDSSTGRSFSGISGRALPLAALEWRYPLVRSNDYVRQVLEPIALGVVAPYGGNSSRIPNEDAQSVEFDETNLFSIDRFPGRDRVESGPRVTYGVRYGVYGPTGGSSSILIGQSLRLKDDPVFDSTSGLEGHKSDYIARLAITPTDWFQYTQRLRLDHSDFNLNRNEVYLNFGTRKPLLLSIGYVGIDRAKFVNGATESKELSLSARVWATDEWQIKATHLRELDDGGGALALQLSLIYQDECIIIANEFNRNFTRDRDILPSTSFHIRFRLRNLG
jgi:LPS-assembly protein